MSQSDQVLCQRIARVTLGKKLPEKRKADIQTLVRAAAETDKFPKVGR
jgi:hypothetical protein